MYLHISYLLNIHLKNNSRDCSIEEELFLFRIEKVSTNT